MSSLMTPRERVLTALNHQEPDRVPTALWGSYYTLQDQTYFKLLRYLNLGDPLPPFRRYKPRNSNYLDDRILDMLQTDTRYVWLGFDDLGGARPDTLTDAWEVKWTRMGDYITPISAPLSHATLDEIESFAWPKPEDFIRLDELRERLNFLKKNGQFAIVARAVNSYGPFEQACAIRGREQFLVDLLDAPELAQSLVNKVTDIIIRLNEIYLDVVGKDIDILEIPGDDYAASKNLIISMRIFKQIFQPALKRIVDPIKQFRPDLVVAFHSDGAVMPLLPALIDVGIDLFHPLEPLPANDLVTIKSQFGRRLSFMGAIDIKTAMTGSIEDVEDEVQRRLCVLAPGGGYILAPANHLQTDVPPQNILALYQNAQRYGHYPIQPFIQPREESKWQTT